MTCKTAPEIYRKCVSEVRNVTAHFLEDLSDAELLTGTPAVTGSADLTIASESINTTVVDHEGVTIGIGKAGQFSVTGGVVPATKEFVDYEIEISVVTDSSPAQTLKGAVILRVYPG